MTSISKRYTFQWIIAIIALLFTTALLTYMIIHQMDIYLIVLVSLLLVALLIVLYSLINFPLRQIAYFLGAIKNKDLMVRFPQSKDPLLAQLNHDMNRILKIYWSNRNEVETRKLYYDRILSIMTHELRNTITPIVSLTDDVVKHPNLYESARTQEVLTIVNEQANNISRFLQAYHQLTHLPQPVLEKVEVHKLFEKLINLMKAERGSDRIRYNIAENMFVIADANLLMLALINIVRNALQAIDRTENGMIDIKASRPDGKPFITITDNGPGIQPNQLETIFLPFFSTKQGGSGIGLSLSKQIMLLHGGDLTVSSKPGVYTTFSLTLNN